MSYQNNIIMGCPECGVSVFGHEGRLYTPLRDYLLTGNIVGRDRYVEHRRAYVEHQCSHEDLERYRVLSEGVTEALQKLIQDNPPQWLHSELQEASNAASSKYSTLQLVTARVGLTRECPRCDAGIGCPCENLTERKRGNSVPTKKPHEERLPLPETLEAAELGLAREETSQAFGLLAQIQEALATENALEKLLRLAGQY